MLDLVFSFHVCWIWTSAIHPALKKRRRFTGSGQHRGPDMEPEDRGPMVATSWMLSPLVTLVVVEASPKCRLVPKSQSVRAHSNDAKLISRAPRLIVIEEEVDAQLRPVVFAAAST
jgi:hypothetical protein